MTTFNSMPTIQSNATAGHDALGLSGVHHGAHGGQSMSMDFDQDMHFDDSLL